MGLHGLPQPGADPERPVHIVFVGAGAVGCFYASRLHHASPPPRCHPATAPHPTDPSRQPSHNIHVSLVARSNYTALATSGVHLRTHTFGDYTFHPHAVFPSVPAAAAARPANPDPKSQSSDRGWDYVVVTTKALPDLADDASLIAPLVGPRTCVVLIQNGVGVEDPYRRRFPTTPIVSAVTVVSAEQTAPGTVRQNRWTRIHLGGYAHAAALDAGGGVPDGDGSRLAARGAACAGRLADWWGRLGGIRDVSLSDEMGLQVVRWHKLCINAAFNPSAVLSGGRGNADMVADAELRAHLRGVMVEIWEAAPRILGGRGFGDGMAPPDRILASTERNPGARPSMLVDWEAGRPMELEVILGNPVRIARAKGVELPRVQTLYALLRSAQAMRARRKGKL
ncbi:2-dehydropantoate 2-reductase [Trichocladium antarcticum]|uniref:2-dehydropantoate 2-reductase n=1 Tax=Trichocladium antarcticum TaxID=1450529 RepID=A0AAN6Z9M5_9PEZI|nr:2-dehydropantoate 2-reductase [Trichocladium antarcticum]